MSSSAILFELGSAIIRHSMPAQRHLTESSRASWIAGEPGTHKLSTNACNKTKAPNHRPTSVSKEPAKVKECASFAEQEAVPYYVNIAKLLLFPYRRSSRAQGWQIGADQLHIPPYRSYDRSQIPSNHQFVGRGGCDQEHDALSLYCHRGRCFLFGFAVGSLRNSLADEITSAGQGSVFNDQNSAGEGICDQGQLLSRLQA